MTVDHITPRGEVSSHSGAFSKDTSLCVKESYQKEAWVQ